MFPSRHLAALALLAGAACASGGSGGSTRISGPGILIEREGGSPPPDTETHEVSYRGPGPFSASVGGEEPETDEGGAQTTGDPAAMPGHPAPSSPVEPAAATDDLLRVLEAVRAENDPWRDFALAIVDRFLEAQAAPAPAAEAPAPDPEPAPFVGPPTPPGHDPELAAILREDEGETLAPYRDLLGYWHIGIGHRITPEEQERLYVEDMTEAEATARRVLGSAFDGLGRWRRNAWIVACYWGACGSYVEMRAATLAGDWEKAAREAQTKALPTSYAAINPERAAEIAHWLRTGQH